MSDQESRQLRLFLLPVVVVLIAVAGVGITFAVRYRNDYQLTAELEHTELELRSLGAQIASIKDADLVSMNDYIAAYAQIESLQNAYDQKFRRFVGLYNVAREKDSHRGLIDIRNFQGRHHPETWQNMSEIISLVQQINEITRREGAVIRSMASLPEPERLQFWHEQFMPLAAQEHALREKLQGAGQQVSPQNNEQ